MGTFGSIEDKRDGDDGPEVKVLRRDIRGNSENTPRLFPGGSTPRRAARLLLIVPEAARGCALSFPRLRPCLGVPLLPTTLEAIPLPWRLTLVAASESADRRGFSGDC